MCRVDHIARRSFDNRSFTLVSVTMATLSSRPLAERSPLAGLVAGWVGVAALLGLVCVAAAPAQELTPHLQYSAEMPPGAIGSWQLQRGGPLPGYFQPVQILAPAGTTVSAPVDGQFDDPQAAPRPLGLLIGSVYRLRVTNIPQQLGQEVFPTVELIDRLYTPRGQERRFAIPIELTQEDLNLAVAGHFVTRVIYLEDPQNATPAGQIGDSQNWFDAPVGRDPLAMADALGRPVAILRLGGRLPDAQNGPDGNFLYHCPPLVRTVAMSDQAVAAPEIAPHQPGTQQPTPAVQPGMPSTNRPGTMTPVPVAAPPLDRTTDARPWSAGEAR